MKLLKWLLGTFAPCPHVKLGKLWFRADDGCDYQRCMNCGRLVKTVAQLGECKPPPWGDGLASTPKAGVSDSIRKSQLMNGGIRRDTIGSGVKDLVN